MFHTEWIDPEGLRNVQNILNSRTAKDKREKNRLNFLRTYISSIDEMYGQETIGPNGMKGRSLRCQYTQTREGRLYCRTRMGPTWDDGMPSYVCIQGMPNALRPFLVRKWVHDIDIENCHACLLYQIGVNFHLWHENSSKNLQPLNLSTLKRVCEDRNSFINHICNVHFLPTDEETYPGYRKKMCKPLLLRILYGGKYDSWLYENNLGMFVKCKDVQRLEKEVYNLREALINSKRFNYIVDSEIIQQKKRKRDDETTKRGLFSKIAQHLECIVLKSMRNYLIKNG